MRGGKKDLSMLFVYASVDNYLIDGGKLGFVITQTVFKTVGAGDGFRRFRYLLDKSTDIYIAPVLTIDLTDLQPFDDATNRSAVFICRKTHKSFSYLVPYWVWTTNVRTLVEQI